MSSNWIRRATRLAIYARDGFECAYCRAPVSTARKPVTGAKLATLDHAVSVRDGGSNEAHNLVTACRECNSAKADEVFAAWLSRLDIERRKHIIRTTAIVPNRAIGRKLAMEGL